MIKIFVHGLGQTDESWEEVVTELKVADSSCPNLKILLNSQEVTFDNLYKVFSKYCDEALGKIDLCGISLGGMLALKYAIDNPSKVNSLVLIGTQYKIPRFLFSLQALVFRFLPKSIFGNTGFSKKEFISLSASMKNIDFSEDLPKIKCKTLLICGEKDFANIKASKKLHKLINSSEISIVPNGKHELNVDSSIELSRILTKFYSGLHET